MKIGIDAVKIERIKSMDKAALDRILTHQEQTLQPESQAGAVAAKEAFAKASGRMPPPWLEIELLHSKNGAPYLKLSDRLTKIAKKVELSITHEAGIAIAIVLLESGN